MDQEHIIKSYDPVIMRRLFSFLKPYKLYAGVALITLFIATAAELMIPVVMQRAIDRELIAETIRVELSQADNLPGIDAGPYRYVPVDRIQNLSREKREKLAPFLETREWYITSLAPWHTETDGNETINEHIYQHKYRDMFWNAVDPRYAQSLINLLRELENEGDMPLDLYASITAKEGYVALPHALLRELSVEQRRVLRRENIFTMGRMAVIYFSLLASGLVFTFFQIYITAYTGQQVMKQIRLDLFDHTIRQSLSFLGNTPVGTLVTRITNDVETINELFTSVATSMLRDISLMAGVLVTIFFLNRGLALITLATIPPVFVATYFFRTKAREAYRRVRLWVSRGNAFLSEHISGMEVV